MKLRDDIVVHTVDEFICEDEHGKKCKVLEYGVQGYTDWERRAIPRQKGKQAYTRMHSRYKIVFQH